MSVSLIIAAVILLVASTATVAVGAAFNWQVTSTGYSTWTRIIGVAAVLGLTGVTAWGRRADTLVAIAIALGGIALAVWYVWMHVRLTNRVKAALGDEPIR